MSARNSSVWETRYVPIEGRATLAEDQTIRGYSIVFNTLSVDLGGFRERILPSAVDRTLREGLDVRAYFNHDTDKVLGRTRSGTLSLSKDAHGLAVIIRPPSTTLAKDLMVSIDRGDISGMSFRFRTLDDNWHMEEGETVRDVIDMVIAEVSVVSEPAYPQTDVAVRSLQAFEASLPKPYRRSPEFLRRYLRAKA